MHYTLHQLEVFYKITQTLSITKAAEELHLTQPAVSIQLRNFQDQFDIPLTEVVGRKLYITDFGKEIAQTVEKILEEVSAINYKTTAFKGKLSGRLKLSVVSTGKYVIPYFLSDFMKKHPEVELVMDVTNKAKVIESLENNEVDFSLVSVLPKHLKINNIELMNNALFVVGNHENSYPEQLYDSSVLETLPLIYREPGSGTRYVMEQYIALNNLPVRKKMELTSNEAVKQAVIAGLGYSIMPLIGIKNELNMGVLQIIPVKGFPIISNWNLIWSQNKKFSAPAAKFLEHITQEKNEIIQHNFAWCNKYFHV